MRKLLLLSLLCLPLDGRAAEWIELQNGTKVEGKILSVTAATVRIEVQKSPTIRGEQSYPRAEVAKIQRAGQDDMAFEEIAAISLPATADAPSVYDAPLEKVRAFMKNYAYSKHMPKARELAASLESERTQVAAGEVKVDGVWTAPGTAGPDRVELEGRVQLAKMKEAADPASALAAFEVLEKNSNTSSSYPESVKLALASIGKLRSDLLRARADLERRTTGQEQGLQLASPDRRLQMEAGIAQETAAVQAQVNRARQSGVKWLPILPDAGVLDDLGRLADAEEARLSQVDTASWSAGVTAAQEARRKMEAGDLAGARAGLEQAGKLWPQHVLLAPLGESLKKAETEAATAAAAAPSQPEQP